MGILTDIAERSDFSETVITTPGTAVVPLCLARTNRYAVGFAASGTAGVTLSTDPSGNGNQGIVLPPTGIQWFNVKDQAALAQVAWFEVSSLAGLKIVVYEIFFPKE